MRERLNLPENRDGDLWYYRNPGRPNTMHRHAELEFNLITRGTGLYLLSNRKYEIRRGDLLWLFPAQEHVLIEHSPDFEMWVAVCKPAAVRRIAVDSATAVLRQSNPAGEYCRRLNQRVHARLDALCSEIATNKHQAALFNSGLHYLLLTAWKEFEHAADVPVSDVHPAVEKAARLIRDEDASLRLDDLARRAGLSSSRLSRLFKQQTGVALVDFRNRRRIERFLELYGKGQRMKMMEAALEAGFGSYPQFHRVFKRLMGCAPARMNRKES